MAAVSESKFKWERFETSLSKIDQISVLGFISGFESGHICLSEKPWKIMFAPLHFLLFPDASLLHCLCFRNYCLQIGSVEVVSDSRNYFQTLYTVFRHHLNCFKICLFETPAVRMTKIWLRFAFLDITWDLLKKNDWKFGWASKRT